MDQNHRGEEYFTPEQMEKPKKHGELLGAEKIKEVENEWPSRIAKVRAELEKGTLRIPE